MRWSIAVVIGAAVVACGVRRLPAPVMTKQPTSALEAVPYPPPPARVEQIPPQPQENSVWIDGEWVWESRRWAWKPGRWVMVPKGVAFAPWVTVRDNSGALYLASGTFRDSDGGAVDDPPPLAIARTRTGTVIGPEGEQVVAPTLQQEALVDGGLSADKPPLEDASVREAADASTDSAPPGADSAPPGDDGGARMEPH